MFLCCPWGAVISACFLAAAEGAIADDEGSYIALGDSGTIARNAGDDNLIGGFASDSFSGNEGNDLALGDNGVIVDSNGSAETHDIFTRSPALGGSDTISGDAGIDRIRFP